MAERRMMSKKVIDTDLFMSMSSSTQTLYFHLLLRADDEGFIGNTKNIMQLTGSNDIDLESLVANKFIIMLPSGICVIRHWNVQNSIQKDRFTSSQYTEEKGLLRITKDRVYVGVDEACIQRVYKLDTKVSKGKGSSVKESKSIEKVELPVWLDLDAWNMWVEHRKEMGKPLSSNAMKIQLEQLSNFTRCHVDMIHRSIESGWARLFESEDSDED